MAEALSYFDHAAGRRREPVVSWDVIEVDGPAAVIAQSEHDARRYRWLKRKNPCAVLSVAYQVREACGHTDPDAAVDAAMTAASRENDGA